MEVTIEEMRAACVTHYVERGYSSAYADGFIPTDEKEIRRIYACIQKEQEVKQIPHRIAGLTVVETAAE